MSLYKIIDPHIGALAVSDTHSTPQFPLGYFARAKDMSSGTAPAQGAGFVYIQGSNASSVGVFVAISGNQAVLAGTVNSTSPSPVGVAAAILSATSVYGWAQVQGLCDFARGTNSSVAAGGPVYVAAGTAGIAGSVSALGNRIIGACFGASYTSSQSNSMSVYLMFPCVNQLTALN